jgi:phytoene/squalene synthetase
VSARTSQIFSVQSVSTTTHLLPHDVTGAVTPRRSSGELVIDSQLGIFEMTRREYSVEESDAYCRTLFNQRLRYSPLSPWFLKLPRLVERPHMLALAVFVRGAEWMVGDATFRGQRPIALDAWEHELNRAFHGDADHPLFVALRDAIDLCKLPMPPFREFMSSCRRDLHRAPFFSFQTLREYCRQRSESLGQLGLQLLGHRDPIAQRYAADFHTALQLTAYLQDLSRDLPHNRCFIPVEDLYHFGITEADLAALCSGSLPGEDKAQAWRDLLSYQVIRARSLLFRGRPLLKWVAPDVGAHLQAAYDEAMLLLDEVVSLGVMILRVRPRPVDGRLSASNLRD